MSLIVVVFWEKVKRLGLLYPHTRVVNITVAPGFSWFNRLNDRVIGLLVMFTGVGIGRIITAADVSTSKAYAKMDPPTIDFEAVLAACYIF